MRVRLTYFSNPDSAEIRLEGICRSVSGCDVSYWRDAEGPRPQFVKELFRIEGVRKVLLSGTANTIGIVKDRSQEWTDIFLDVLTVLQRSFDPDGEVIMDGQPRVLHRKPLPGDFLEMAGACPRRTPPRERQHTLW